MKKRSRARKRVKKERGKNTKNREKKWSGKKMLHPRKRYTEIMNKMKRGNRIKKKTKRKNRRTKRQLRVSVH